MVPKESDPDYLRASNVAIYNAMTQVVPDAVFVMQGWLFLNAADFWTNDRIEAYLSGVPNASMLILDLFTDSIPVWSRPGLNSYYGKPWVWNLLLIFGGRRGVYGNLTRVGVQPLVDLATEGSTMVGLGFTPEATEQAPVLFDLLFDIGWRSAPPDVDAWLANWVLRRYGAHSPSLQAAWALLRGTSLDIEYDYGTTKLFCPIADSPQLTPAIDRAGPNATAIAQALRLFVVAGLNGEVSATASSTYSYDLVDITRQALCYIFGDAAGMSGAEYLRFTSTGVNTSATVTPLTALQARMIADLDAVLATDTNYLLGHWTADARLWAGGNATLAAYLEEDARNLVTTWGFVGSGVEDYAQKNGWAGLVSDYYGQRWALHTQYMADSLRSGQPIDWAQYSAELGSLEQAWIGGNNSYPTTPSGQDPLTLAAAAVAAYASGNASHYQVYHNSDAPPYSYIPVDIFRAKTADPSVLMTLCDTDPACLGFNSNGYMKNDTYSLGGGQPGVTFWAKRV